MSEKHCYVCLDVFSKMSIIQKMYLRIGIFIWTVPKVIDKLEINKINHQQRCLLNIQIVVFLLATSWCTNITSQPIKTTGDILENSFEIIPPSRNAQLLTKAYILQVTCLENMGNTMDTENTKVSPFQRNLQQDLFV